MRVNAPPFYNDIASDNCRVCHCSLKKKKKPLQNGDTHRLDQIAARSIEQLHTNAYLSQTKATVVSEEKPDKDMISVIS